MHASKEVWGPSWFVLTNYLSARGLNTSGRKVELVATVFPAFEVKMNKISSSEELQ